MKQVQISPVSVVNPIIAQTLKRRMHQSFLVRQVLNDKANQNILINI